LFQYRLVPRTATYTHGNNALEIAWTIAPSLILVAGALSRTSWYEIKAAHRRLTEARVNAKQFNWDFTIPDRTLIRGRPRWRTISTCRSGR
jgi:heme/copper-type cytochrome/quinol oxidase subunit 2